MKLWSGTACSQTSVHGSMPAWPWASARCCFCAKQKQLLYYWLVFGFFYKHCGISISVPIDLSFFSNWTVSQYSNRDRNKKRNKADQPE